MHTHFMLTRIDRSGQSEVPKVDSAPCLNTLELATHKFVLLIEEANTDERGG